MTYSFVLRAKFICPANALYNPLGTEDHHDHHDDSEKEHPVIAEGTEVFRQQDEKEGADDDADDRTRSAENDNGEDHGRFQKGEACRVNEGSLCREEYTDKAGPGRTQGKGSQLDHGLINTHGLAGDFVLP